MSDLADTLDAISADGPSVFYSGPLARAMCEAVRERGGLLTEPDLADYRVIRRRPVRARYHGHEFVSNAPPSSGGLLIAFALRVLDRIGMPGPPGSAAALAALTEVMRETTLARGGHFLRDLYRGGLPARLLDDPSVEAAATRALGRTRKPAREPAGIPSTTHISVVDGKGNAASLSASTGCGSGVIVPGTGIHVNNMLGETDLNVSDRRVTPGHRLTSMMAPSVVLADGGPRLVVGSAGSIRLRAAILQIVVNVVAHDLPLDEAIAAPRIHLEGELLNLEGGIASGVADELEERGYDVVRWSARNLYFGGASAVVFRPDGGLEAAGDPRRGGAGVVVE
jgi:gamma-glutamyltranspeptidase/glutathione hydrolase